MKKLLYILLLSVPAILSGQIPTFSLDPNLDYFEGGSPLPAETRWKLNGQAPEGTEVVRLVVVENGKLFDQPDFSASQQLRKGDRGFEMFMDFPLRSGKEYDFRFTFLSGMSSDQSTKRQAAVMRETDAYLDHALYSNGTKVKLRQSPGATFKDLNQILRAHFPEVSAQRATYSERVQRELRSLNGLKLREAKYNLAGNEEQAWKDSKLSYLESLADNLKGLLKAEVGRLGQEKELKTIGERTIRSYPVEKRSFSLPINVGYAGIYRSGSWNSLDYATAPYAGISVPIGGRRIGEHLSLGVGAFLTNLTFDNGDVATGPLVGRPVYAALGVRTLRIFRIQAGLTALQTTGQASTADVSLRPFVGAAIEINFWAGFQARR